EGVRGSGARLSREHRLRPGLAHWRAYGRRRQGCEGRVDGRELFEDPAVRGREPHWRVGPELRRIFHADRHDGSAETFPGRGGRGGRRGLRDVLFGSLSRRLDGEPHRDPGGTSGCLRERFTDLTY